MRIEFPYPNYHSIGAFEVPDANLAGVYAPRRATDLGITAPEDLLIKAALASPQNARPLRDLARREDRVLILFDDATRTTPIERLLTGVLDELNAASVPPARVTLLSAPGTHRAMSDHELRGKLGAHHDRFRVVQHRWLDSAELHDYGRTPDGVRVTANRLMTESDLVIGLGAIVPHRVKGFSGGAKIAFPGVSGREMMDANQWDASLRMAETVMGVAENPMRARMEAAARLVGLRYIVNAVQDRDGRLAGCFAGDLVAAHRAGCALAREVYRADLAARADIVVIDAHPADRDLWQSVKALYAGSLAVRRGGTLVVVAPNPEGVASNHPVLMKMGYRPHAEIIEKVAAGVDDLVGVAILADIAQIVDHADCVMVSPGVSRDDCARLGMRRAATADDALAMAFERQGSDARVAVLHHGGHILPVVREG
jgi:nickel-dependent lactate racemase